MFVLSRTVWVRNSLFITVEGELYNLPDIFTNENNSPSIKRLTPFLNNGLKASRELHLFSWQFRFFVFHFHVIILLYNLAVFKSLPPVSRLVRRWYRFISKYNKLITSFPCICCLSSLVTMQLLGIAFILYLLKLSAGNGLWTTKYLVIWLPWKKHFLCFVPTPPLSTPTTFTSGMCLSIIGPFYMNIYWMYCRMTKYRNIFWQH